MRSGEVIGLIDALAEPAGRQAALATLARQLGGDSLLLFASDPELGVILPAPGTPQVLRGAEQWRQFLASCVRDGSHTGMLSGADGEATLARGCALEDGTAAVLVGGTREGEGPERLRPYLSLLGSLFRRERQIAVGAVRARAADEAVERSRVLTRALEQMLGRLEIALAEAEAARNGERERAEQAEALATELEAQAVELQYQATQLEETQGELEVANDDLIRANEDLVDRADEAERSRRQAEEAHAIADVFYEGAPIPTALVDRDLRFLRVNHALAAFYGLSPEEVVGRTIREVVPQYADRVEPYYRQVLETGEPIRNREVVVPSRVSPSEERHFLVSYFPVQVGEAEVIGVGVVAMDVTERYQVEAAQQEQAALVETLQHIGRSVASELDLENVVQEVTDAATTLTGAQFGAFFYNVLNEEGEAYTLYTISGVAREEFSKFPMPRATGVFEPTFHGTATVRSDDITQDPRYGRMAPYHGMPKGHLPVTSYLAVPVVSRTGAVLGGLFFGHAEPGRFQERHGRLAEGIAGWAAVAMDNAQLYQAERLARTEAERANQVKSEFLATVSHELRTPLNAMLGYTDLLLMGIPEPIPAGAQQKVERIGVSARHLLELIEEILSFSRLEAGEEHVEIESVQPDALIDEVQALMEPLALTKGIAFDCSAPPEPPQIQTDARKIRQILINLVGNAIKFTDEGTVRLTLVEIGDEAIFRVEDTGAGIAPEHLERIFDPFWQIQGGATRTTGGTGLGLSVARRMARLLRGDLNVESEPGKGSVFTLTIPTAMETGE